MKALWEKVRQRLSRLCRAERIRKHSKRKRKEQASFFKDPFRYARQLLEEWEAWNHQGATVTAFQRPSKEHPIRNTWVRASTCTTNCWVQRHAPPSSVKSANHEENKVLMESLQVISELPQGTRAAVVPHAWKKQLMPSEWQRSVAVSIPKEANSKSAGQKDNHLSRRREFQASQGVWSTLTRSRRLSERKRQTCTSSGLVSRRHYDPVPYQLISYAMESFHMPSCMKNMVASWFNDLQMCSHLPPSHGRS